MADFLLIVVAALIVAGLVFGVVAFTLGREDGLSDLEPDTAEIELPEDRVLTAGDLERIRFDVVIRGYRMDQVDALVARATRDLRRLQERVDLLEQDVVELRKVPDGEPA